MLLLFLFGRCGVWIVDDTDVRDRAKLAELAFDVFTLCVEVQAAYKQRLERVAFDLGVVLWFVCNCVVSTSVDRTSLSVEPHNRS